MSPLQEFFLLVHTSIDFRKGGGVALHCVENGTYKDVVDMLRCLLLVQKPEQPTYIAKESGTVSAGPMLKFLKLLVTKDPQAIREMQAYGFTFLEQASATSFVSLIMSTRSIFAELCDSEPDIKEMFWKHYDSRAGLDAMIFSDQPLGFSTSDEGYHNDLVVKIMDALSDDLDEKAIIDYLSKCKSDAGAPEMNWGAYLHPKATPYIQSWILANQRLSNVMTDGPYMGAALKTAYARPYDAMVRHLDAGRPIDGLEALERVTRALDIREDDKPKLGWLLSVEPDTLGSFYDALSADAKDDMLLFGLRNNLPLPGNYIPGHSEMKKAMVESCFLALAKRGLPETFVKKAIDEEIKRRHAAEHSWWLPVAINANPDYFSEQMHAINAWDTYSLLSKTTKSLAAYTSAPARAKAWKTHANAQITTGRQSNGNPTGILIKLDGDLCNLEGFKQVAVHCLERSLSEEVEREKVKAGSDKPRSRKVFLKSYLEAMRPKDCLQMVIHDLLDKTGVQMALGFKSIKVLLPEVDFSKDVIEKMTPAQQSAMLERDLGL